MPSKTGGGGHQENYDENTGKYIAKDAGSSGLQKFHSGSGFSNQQLIDKINNGDFGNEIRDFFSQASSEEQEGTLEYLHTMFDQGNTELRMSERYTPMDRNEFFQWQNQVMNNSPLTYDDLEAIGHYTGTGSTSFYLNTAMRFGYPEMLRQFMEVKGYNPNNDPTDYLSEAQVQRFQNAMEKATHSVQAPRDMRVDRYVGTGPIVSWFKDTGVLDGLKMENNGWHEHLVPGSYDLKDLADRLSQLIGSELPRDGSYMSFSASPSLSHMKGKGGSQKKDILMKIDVPKGQNMHLTRNTHESEGMFPRDVDFYLKDVKLETDDEGKDRIVLYYGIKR